LTGKIRWLLIGWIFIISSTAFLDRVNISVAGKAIERDFGLTDLQFGWIASAFLTGYALFQAPAGRVVDRFGPRVVLGFATIWWAVFTALTGLVPAGLAWSLALLIGVRFALGLGEAVMYPAGNRFVASWIPVGERGLANGLIFAGVGVGSAASPPIVVAIMTHYGWRASFGLSALIGVAVGSVWYALCRDKPADHPWVTQAELARIQSGLPATAAIPRPIPLRIILSDRNMAALTFSYFTFGYTAYMFFTWFFIYLSSVRGLNLKSSAFFGTLPFVAMAVSSPLGGWVSDQLSRRYGMRAGRCAVAGVAIGFAALFLALGPHAQDPRLASIVLAGGAGALYVSQSMFWSVTSEIAGTSSGFVSGVMNMGCQIGGAITASLSPWIAREFGWTASFTTAAALCALGALAWMLVHPEVPIVELELIER
jgi:ACS family glucarate transporter-like MFS transporter